MPHRVFAREQFHQRQQMPNGSAAGFVSGSPGEEVHLVQIVPVFIGKFLDPLADKVLVAAALTYVASLITTVREIVRLILSATRDR